MDSQIGPLPAGTILGKYEILTRLTVGGMAEIYAAKLAGFVGIDNVVVLKRMLPHLRDKNDYIEMFLEEARITSSLHHPNIVRGLEFGKFQDEYFFAMEYLHGVDLRTLMRVLQKSAQKIPISHALYIVEQTARALAYAHGTTFGSGGSGLIHGDVSPANILVGFDGSVRIIDFGVAKSATSATAGEKKTVKGNVHYMSPEQARAEKFDHHSDIFSLGVILYELTTHRRLFVEASELLILHHIAFDEVMPPSTFLKSYPADLEGIVMRALAKDPAKRYHSAHVLAADLITWSKSHEHNCLQNEHARYLQNILGSEYDEAQQAHDDRTLADYLVKLHARRRTTGVIATDTDQVLTELPKTNAPAPEQSPSMLARFWARSWLFIALVIALGLLKWSTDYYHAQKQKEEQHEALQSNETQSNPKSEKKPRRPKSNRR